MKDRENYQPLCGLSLEKPISILFPIIDTFSGVTGLGLTAYIVYSYHTRIEMDTFSSSRTSRLHNFQIVKWITFIAFNLSLLFLAILLRKGALSKNVTLLNLWVMITLLHSVIAVSFMFASALFFSETFELSIASIAVVYQVIKFYFCHVVRFYALELIHERKVSVSVRPLTDGEISDFKNGVPGLSHQVGVQQTIHKVAQQNGYQQHFEIDFSRLSIGWNCPLGKGEFASVYKGHLDDDNYSTDVAVKVIDANNADACCFKLILSELKVMTYVGEHPNVVQLIGANTSKIEHRKLFIILEFCAFGSILDRLRVSRGFFRNHVQDGLLLHFELNSKNETSFKMCPGEEDSISTIDLLRWSHQIAKGMEFLASKRLVHGDLAARNVLLTDQKIAKITDFGLSRQLYQYSVYTKKSQQPVPWMNLAIESIIDHQFSTQSDIWSYGITLWEIFSLGEVPYPGYSFGNHFIKELRNGLRPTFPSNAPIFMHQLMKTCWNHNPKQRPTFTEIHQMLRSYS